MQQVFEALEKVGCDISYGLKMHMNREDYFLRDLKQLPYDKTMDKLERALDNGDSNLCYFYTKSLNVVYAGLGLLPALYISDCIAETAKGGNMTGIYSLYSRLCKLHHQYVDIIKSC